jgi:hypothetical protein
MTVEAAVDWGRERRAGLARRRVAIRVDRPRADVRDPVGGRGWIDVSFHVAAPLRKPAFEVALRALHRGFTAVGETDYGYTGKFDLHAVG